MSLEFDVDDRFVDAADQWGDARMMDREEALDVKVEQALLEIENLAADAYEVDYEVDGRTVRHEPTDGLVALLDRQSEETGLEPSDILKLYTDLFARAFLDPDEERPPNAPPPEE